MQTDLVNKIQQWHDHPEDFQLIERIPVTKTGCQWPVNLHEPVGDEITMVILDTETTGLSLEEDVIIELGLVKISYSKSAKRITSILDVVSLYEDPKRPIPEHITQLTGITQDMVTGKSIDEALVAQWLHDKQLTVAHNAKFDRPVFEKRFPNLTGLYWACSFQGIDWDVLSFESRKLKYLLKDAGWFYEGHRASIDCLAVAWLFYVVPESLTNLLDNARKNTVVVKALGAPFDVKDQLKARGYFWQPNEKYWCTEIFEADLPAEQGFLKDLYPRSETAAEYTMKSAKERFKSSV